MATDIKKYLDQSGVSTLWTAIAEKVAAVNAKADTNTSDISTMKGQIAALEAGTYDDSSVRALIKENADAIAVLNGEGTGSVKDTASQQAALKVAEIVAGADESFDTLKEIADWILNDTTGAAGMAADIAALETLVGDTAVATQISTAITEALKVEGIDKYALATDLTDLTTRVKALEDAGYQTSAQVNTAINAAIAALNLSTTYEVKGAADTALASAKSYADSLASNYDAAGTGAAQAAAALTEAKAYTDTAFDNIQALTEAEIQAAINAASNT